MDEAGDIGWERTNRAFLADAVAELKALLQRHLQSSADASSSSHPGAAPRQDGFLPTLEIVSRGFRLSPFERDILLLCGAAELDHEVAALCGAVQNDPLRNYPTFSVALAVFPDTHWSALIRADRCAAGG